MRGSILAASAVIVVDSSIVLVRRGRGPATGLWSVPGGRVEDGESLPEAAAREVLEETGLVVEVGEELGQVRVEHEGTVYEIHDFAATPLGGTLAAGDDAAEVRWVTLESLADLPLTHGLLEFLRQAGIVS